MYNIFRNRFGLMSENDKFKIRKNFDNMENEIKTCNESWNSIKKKNIKNTVVENYVIRMKKLYKLNTSQSKKLLSVIIIGLLLKTITTDDIIYVDNNIENIKGIDFQNNKIIIKKIFTNLMQKYPPK